MVEAEASSSGKWLSPRPALCLFFRSAKRVIVPCWIVSPLQKCEKQLNSITYMGKITMSFEQGRKELLVKMSARSRKQPIKKVIPFRNDDVPNYLRELDKFEEKSRQANLVVS